jgi:hypothetical protein
LNEENVALEKQLGAITTPDEKKHLEEITSLNEEKAAVERQLAATTTPDEKLMEQVLDLRKELAAAQAAVAAAQAAWVQAVNLRSTETPDLILRAATSFSIDTRRLTTYDGTRDAKLIVNFLSDIKRSCVIRCQEIGWLKDGQPETTGWSTYAIGQLRGAAGTWADAKYPSSSGTPDSADFERSLRAEFTPLNTVRELVEKWTAVRLAPSGHVATFNVEFQQLRQELDLIPEHALTPIQKINAYIQKVRSNGKGDEHLTSYVELRQDIGVELNL